MLATRTMMLVAGAMLSMLVQPAGAEILSAEPGGFSIRHVVETAGVPPSTAWAALSDIGKWWDPDHTYSGDARNLTLEPMARGCFCEKLGLYAGIEHAHVVYAQPAKILRLIGSLGPLQEFGVTGSLTWQLEAAGGGSRITVTYNVGGHADRPLSEWAPIVDEVVGAQVKRFARFVVTGSPAETKAEPRP